MDVGGWLRSLRLAQYETAFRENAVDDTSLTSLTAEDLKDLGVGLVGHRRKLLDAIVALRTEEKAPPLDPVWTSGLAGNPADAAAMIGLGAAAMRSTGATAYAPWYLSNLAMAQAQLGQRDEAWRCIGEATAAVETSKERWCENEIHRMAGEIALLATEPDAAQAEACFARALAVARAQQARSWELRAAMCMARLWGDQGKRQQAHDLHTAVFGSFAEGFSLDLTQARTALDAPAP